MAPPQFWIVAGPNGAGKSTCVQSEPIANILPQIEFLNPDDRTRQKLLARGHRGFADAPEPLLRSLFVESATEIENELIASIGMGKSIGAETVLSTDKYRRIVEDVHRRGGAFNLIYITVSAPQIAVARVAIRVSRGGHGVPPDKVIDRYYRSHFNLNWFASQADNFWVIDNSGSDRAVPPIMPAYGAGGRLAFLDPHASDLLKCVLSTLPRSSGPTE